MKLVFDLDKLESEGMPLSEACDTMRGRTGWYDPVILEVLAKVRGAQESSEVRELPVSSLRPGMILAQDVRNRKGNLFAARGQEVTRGWWKAEASSDPICLAGLDPRDCRGSPNQARRTRQHGWRITSAPQAVTGHERRFCPTESGPKYRGNVLWDSVST